MLLKHRELLACVVVCNSFETAWFLKKGYTCFHFVAYDHYNVKHAQTSDLGVSAVAAVSITI